MDGPIIRACGIEINMLVESDMMAGTIVNIPLQVTNLPYRLDWVVELRLCSGHTLFQ